MSRTARRPPNESEATLRTKFRMMLAILGFAALLLLLSLLTLGAWWMTSGTPAPVVGARPSASSAPLPPQVAPPVPQPVPAPAPPPVAVVVAGRSQTARSVRLPARTRPGVAGTGPAFVTASATGQVMIGSVRRGARVVAGQVVARIATKVRVADPAPGEPGSGPRTGEPNPARPGGVRFGVARVTEVRAPADGIVTQIFAAPGLHVSHGQALLRLTRTRASRYQAEGPAERLAGLRAGAPARLRTASGSTLAARVRAVSDLPGGRRTVVEVAPVGTQRVPVPGAKVWVDLRLPPSPATATVPTPAVRRTPDGAVVWIVRRGADGDEGPTWTAHRRSVRTGASARGKTEIQTGVAPGGRVIVAGMEQLRDGQAVAAIPWNLP